MRYLGLAVGYDGTLASHGRISVDAANAIERVRVSGRRVILVTGRRLDELRSICDCVGLFDLIVAENGGLVYDPTRREETELADPPSPRLLDALRASAVAPLEIGRVAVATRAPQRKCVQDVIWELGLESQTIANRGVVLVLPPGVNKGSGLEHALRSLGLSRHEVVGIGDAENDHSLLARCECAIAVADAVPSLKAAADFVTDAANGAGVVEVVDRLVADDLSHLTGRLREHLILLGTKADGSELRFAPYGHNILVAGPSGSGKSTLTAALIERLIEKDYQVCIVDPEGDYGTLNDVVALGNQWRAPSVSEVLSMLEDPQLNLSVNLLGIPLADRPEFIAQLIPNLQALRARTGRPHWLVLDEAHHMLPRTWGHAGTALPQRLGETILVTVHPDHVDPSILAPIDVAIAIGRLPEQTLGRFAAMTGRHLAWPEGLEPEHGEVVVWFAGREAAPFAVEPKAGRAERIRHQRKYAEGDLRWHSFYFRGSDGRLNLKAQNLAVFCQIAQGVDEETWRFHLRRGDYSHWLRTSVRDEFLASEAERIERRDDLPAWQTRQMIVELIRSRYTLPE